MSYFPKIYVTEYVPAGTLVITPEVRNGETMEEWMDRCVVVNNVAVPEQE